MSKLKTKYHPASKGIRSIFIGIVANLFLALIKGFAGVIGNSYALIADSIESTVDVFSSIIVWNGLRISRKPPDKDHPYGHGKAEPLTVVFISLALLGAAIVIAIQSYKQIVTPHLAPAPFTLGVLVIVFIIKELLFRYVYYIGVKVGSTAVKTDAWHHRSDALTSAAAFIGILIALIGGSGYESADDWAALAASGIIVFNAYRLLRPALAELMDTAPPEDIELKIREAAASIVKVKSLDKCLVRKVGFEYYVDLHVVVDGNLTVKEGHKIGHQVKDAIKASNERIADVLIHIEPFEEIWTSHNTGSKEKWVI